MNDCKRCNGPTYTVVVEGIQCHECNEITCPPFDESALAWRAAHDVVKGELELERARRQQSDEMREAERAALTKELDETRRELEEIRAERQRAQLRSVGHERYGEGAIADGPGVPLPLTVHELVDVVEKLVGNLAEQMRPRRRPQRRQQYTCTTCTRTVENMNAMCDVCVADSFPGHGAG